jgi:hypothetical protein
MRSPRTSPEVAGSRVNRLWNGTPDRLPIGTPVGSDHPGRATLTSSAGVITGRTGLVVEGSGAVLEAPALVASLNDLAMMGEPVEERGGHFGVAGEHAWPLPEGEVRGDDD